MTDIAADQAVEAVETDETPVDQTDDDQQSDDQRSDDQAEDDGLDDWEDEEGNVYRVPKALKEGHMKNADYTNKTKELARERSAAEAEKTSLAEQRQAIQKQDEFLRTQTAEIAKLGAIDHQIQEWNQWLADNPDAATPADYHKVQTLKEARDWQARSLGQKMQAAAAEAQQNDAKALDAMRTALSKDIPGYSPKLESEIFTAAVDLGFQPEEISAVRDPKIVKVLHLAMLGKQATAKQSAAKTVQAQQATAPAPQVGGKRAPPTGLDDRLSAEEWTRRRNEQIRKRGG